MSARDVYHVSHIEQGIVSTLTAIAATACAHGAINIEYMRGAVAFARCQASMYGVEWKTIIDQVGQPALGQGLAGLLECFPGNMQHDHA